MTENIWLQIIITAGLVLAAFIPAYFGFRGKLTEINKGTQAAAKDAASAASDSKSAADDAREARVQVKNSHDTNLREEQDERHEATIALLRELGRDIRGLHSDQLEMRKSMSLLHAEDRSSRRENRSLREVITEHMAETAQWSPMLHQLYQKWATQGSPSPIHTEKEGE